MTSDNDLEEVYLEKEFNRYFDSNQDRHFERLKELGGLGAVGIPDVDNVFPGLFPVRTTGDEVEPLKFTLWSLYKEVVYSYVYELDRLAILGCRAVVERALRVAYHVNTGKSITEAGRTLGQIIKSCSRDSVIDDRTEELAKIVLDQGNNMAHANWEKEEVWSDLQFVRNPEQSEGPPIAYYPHYDNPRRVVLATRDILRSLSDTESLRKPRLEPTDDQLAYALSELNQEQRHVLHRMASQFTIAELRKQVERVFEEDPISEMRQLLIHSMNTRLVQKEGEYFVLHPNAIEILRLDYFNE